jgi:polysaccharide export outer membrane protein
VGQTITVLGEVESPGTHTMARTRLNIFEAIGVAGDVTDWGNYKEVMLLREMGEGKLIATVDLQNPELIESPYYYILPNDVLYVKLDKKVRGSKNVAPFTGITLALSIITTTLVVATFIIAIQE